MTVGVGTVPLSPELALAFADVLDYPHSSPIVAAHACAALLREENAEAAGLLESFYAAAGRAPLGELQEAYTRTFDLDTMSRSEPTAYPYVGHYLFEETHKRGVFILGLRRRFGEHGFHQLEELDDHLVVMLRFLAVCDDGDLACELVDDAILPALAKILAAERRGESLRHVYLDVLRALQLALAGARPASDPVESEAEREWLRAGDSLGIQRSGHNH